MKVVYIYIKRKFLAQNEARTKHEFRDTGHDLRCQQALKNAACVPLHISHRRKRLEFIKKPKEQREMSLP